MKAERLSRLLDQAVGNEHLISRIHPEFLHRNLYFIMRANEVREAWYVRGWGGFCAMDHGFLATTDLSRRENGPSMRRERTPPGVDRGTKQSGAPDTPRPQYEAPVISLT